VQIQLLPSLAGSLNGGFSKAGARFSLTFGFNMRKS